MIQQSRSWGEKKNPNSKKKCTSVFTEALFTIAKTGKQSKCPSADDWIKMWYVYTMEYYSAIKRNAIWPFATTQWTWRRGH